MNGPPENAPYMIAAYAVAALIVVGYALTLIRRGRRNDADD